MRHSWIQREGSAFQMLSMEKALTILVDPTTELLLVDNFICILQKCKKERNLASAKLLYARICNYGLEPHKAVGNHIVRMFVECGSVSNAQQVFDRVVHRNVHSWTSLILGYINCGRPQHALILYKKMEEDTVSPSRYTFLALLKACAKLKDAKKGREVHNDIAKEGLDKDLFIASTLVDMYAKSGLLSQAREIFDKLPVRTVVSWTALIAGYAEHGSGQEALKCFEQMQSEGISPNFVTFLGILKACGSIGAIDKGRLIHAEIIQKGFERDLFIGNTLVDMYAKCGSLSDAQKIFDKLPVRNVVSWTALISGYAECGLGEEALKYFELMQLEGVSPNAITFACILKACCKIGAIDKGREIHRKVTQKGYEGDPFVGSTLVDMYARDGSFLEAREVFDKLPVRSIMTWNALIIRYAEQGYEQEVLKCFEQMQQEGVSPDAVTLTCVLKACAGIGAIDKGREVHMEIASKGIELDIFVGNTLINMYAKYGSLSEARRVFDKLPIRSVVSWNTLVTGYVEHGYGQEALKCFEQMQLEGVSPDAVTYICILKACGSIRAIGKGREVHIEIAQKGLEKDIYLGNTLIDMYAKCGSLSEACEVFYKIPVRDVVSWNALISGYAEHGPGQEALTCFEQMQLEGVSPSAVTFVCILKACGRIGAIDKGQEIHAEVTQRGFESDLFVGSALIDMYAKCGSLSKAQEVSDKLLNRSVVSWTALIAGYLEHGSSQEAVKCFDQMQLDGISPNAVTFVYVLKACGTLGAIDKGREMHGEIKEKGFERDVYVGSTMVEMYAKCGALSEAREVFEKLPVRDVVSWNAMIDGYGMNHAGAMAVQCFQDMQEQGVKPNAITFTFLFSACSHMSMVFKGQEYLKVMIEDYGIVPTIDHYNCMVDLLARSGDLYEAEKFLENIPYPLSIETWTVLLSACKTYGEPELGLRCFQQLAQMNPENAASYVLMASIYTNAGRREDAFRIEKLRKLAGAKKKPASALIEVNKKVHEFVVGDNQSKEISAMLEILSSRMKEEGHMPNLDVDLRSISDEEKEVALCEHAEKLALAFGFLNTPPGQTLRIIKNMKMCNNCHNANKIISWTENREIFVRDSYCIHHFKDGLCSCTAVF